MNDNFARLVCMVIVGGVAKSLFGRPVSRPIGSYLEPVGDLVEKVKS